MDQLHDIWHFAPQTWDRSINVGEINIYSGAEYDEVEFDICKAVKNASGIQSLTRVQNIFDFGMFLMRSQVLAVDNRQETYYKTRRYVTIPAFLKEDALANNLDHRHLNMNTFVLKVI
ncbi:hypothetical protein HHI36_015805 [Cryptolaemus montrouzieri]|uniref:Uncharacterized protein n=1 Tax=Cryptolaemus montrouzieri TaxID=559131 RepID=A0ABD2N708_9CUCU